MRKKKNKKKEEKEIRNNLQEIGSVSDGLGIVMRRTELRLRGMSTVNTSCYFSFKEDGVRT